MMDMGRGFHLRHLSGDQKTLTVSALRRDALGKAKTTRESDAIGRSPDVVSSG